MPTKHIYSLAIVRDGDGDDEVHLLSGLPGAGPPRSIARFVTGTEDIAHRCVRLLNEYGEYDHPEQDR